MENEIRNIYALVAYFLIPGALVAVGYGFAAKLMIDWKLPNIVGLGISAIVIMIPIELGAIIQYSKSNYGESSISLGIQYNENVTMKYYFIYTPITLIWAILSFVIGNPISKYIKDGLFSWIPSWYVLSDNFSPYNKTQLLIALFFMVFVTGLALPIVEELYFRGFLLPRMEWMGIYAPILNAALFSLYHFWSPWQFIVRVVALIPFCYVSYKTKSIKIPIIVHCLLNIMGDSGSVISQLKKVW